MATTWRINEIVHDFDITGCLIPWQDDLPILIHMPNIDDVFFVLFSTEDRLRSSGITCTQVKRIDDPAEFLDSLPLRVSDGVQLRLIIDPYVTAKGTTRFKEIQRHVH